jgi:hypothetical protein
MVAEPSGVVAAEEIRELQMISEELEVGASTVEGVAVAVLD